MISRFYCPFPLHPGATVELDSNAAHHALRVLKVDAGDTAILFDGHGGQWLAELQPAGKRLNARLLEFSAGVPEPALAVTLVQCLPAADKMDWVVQKAVELGVTAIQPLEAKRSVVRLAGERKERRAEHWRGVARAACEQSGRNRVPEIAPIRDLPAYLGLVMQENPQQNDACFICVPTAASGFLRDRPRPTGAVRVLVGPEGGFEAGELAAAQTAGFMPLTLGPHVLRTETAGLAALAAMMTLWGDW
jgi:16S rRNA (uracil1498-N3)-methyltransferase